MPISNVFGNKTNFHLKRSLNTPWPLHTSKPSEPPPPFFFFLIIPLCFCLPITKMFTLQSNYLCFRLPGGETLILFHNSLMFGAPFRAGREQIRRKTFQRRLGSNEIFGWRFQASNGGNAPKQRVIFSLHFVKSERSGGAKGTFSSDLTSAREENQLTEIMNVSSFPLIRNYLPPD